MKIIDVEIKKGILGKNELPAPGIEYCGGWRDFANMGVAVICVFDTQTRETRVFTDDNLEYFEPYVRDCETGGFNTIGFDIPLLEHHGLKVNRGLHFDALRKIWIAQGLDPDSFNFRTHGGWSLDNIMQSTFGVSKSGHGAMAPVWWQQGKVGKVIDYCCRDVWLEAKLIEHMRAGGAVFKEPIGVRAPC